jgi:uncharacterized membrane protein
MHDSGSNNQPSPGPPRGKEQMPASGTGQNVMDAGQGSIVVKAPVADVYKRWLKIEDYPKFITAIEWVRKVDENRFAASVTVQGEQHDAVLEIMLRVPERRLAWRTISGDHLGVGVVSFTSQPDQSTCLNLKLTSSFAGAIAQRVDEYLRNFKRLAEQADPA